MAGTPTNAINVNSSGIVSLDLDTFSASAVTQHDVLVGGANQAITSVSPSTAGFVLTSNGVAADPSFQAAAGGSGIVTLDGDSGSATGTTVTITAGSLTNQTGATVKFTASSASVNFSVTDGNDNTIIGFQAGTTLSTGTGNTALGHGAMEVITSGVSNVAIGELAGAGMTSGGYNIGIGSQACGGVGGSGSGNICLGHGTGVNYTATESRNILINSFGVSLDTNTLRIGQATGTGDQDLEKAFISGINGQTATGIAVGVSSTDQLTAGGVITNPAQPAFQYVLNSNDSNATGDGTNYQLGSNVALTKVFDNNNDMTTGGVFTAPVTGLYMLGMSIVYGNAGTSNLFSCSIANNLGGIIYTGPTALTNLSLSFSVLHNMTAADAINFLAFAQGGTLNITVSATTRVWGYLVC